MKATLKASILAITLLSAGATAMAHERYPDSDRYYEGRGYEGSRYDAPEVFYDRYGNRVYATRSQRYAAPVEDQCHRAPVYEERHRASVRFEPPFFSPLRFLFRR